MKGAYHNSLAVGPTLLGLPVAVSVRSIRGWVVSRKTFPLITVLLHVNSNRTVAMGYISGPAYLGVDMWRD